MTIRVMLADDHAVVRDGLRALLGKFDDIEVVCIAANGLQAIELAAKARPDVVVMDIGMPEFDGIDATRRLCERLPGCRVLMLSMHLTSEHVVRALHAGACGYLLKESAGEEVVAAIRAVAGGRRYLSHQISELVIDDILRDGVQESPLERLSQRESEVLKLVVEGQSSAHIGRQLSLSTKTVETYRARLMRKLGVKDTVELVKFAMRHGLTT